MDQEDVTRGYRFRARRSGEIADVGIGDGLVRERLVFRIPRAETRERLNKAVADGREPVDRLAEFDTALGLRLDALERLFGRETLQKSRLSPDDLRKSGRTIEVDEAEYQHLKTLERTVRKFLNAGGGPPSPSASRRLMREEDLRPVRPPVGLDDDDDDDRR
jgi:hypothetical protein